MIFAKIARAGRPVVEEKNTSARFESTLGRNTGNRRASSNILFIVRTVGKILGRVSTLALIYKQLFIFTSWNGKQRTSDAGPWECSSMIGWRRTRSRG